MSEGGGGGGKNLQQLYRLLACLLGGDACQHCWPVDLVTARFSVTSCCQHESAAMPAVRFVTSHQLLTHCSASSSLSDDTRVLHS